MNKYLAITIGPIYKTMALARSTSELWGASYIFSFLTEKLIEALTIILQSKGTFILPVSDNTESIEAGFFPDRLLIQLDKKSEFSIGDFDALKDEVIKKHFNGELIPYFQVYSLIIKLDDKIDPIQAIMPLLDSMELKQCYVEEYKKNQLKEFLLAINKWSAFNDLYNDNYHFPSLQRIASSDLRKYDDVTLPKYIDNDDDSLSVYDKIVIHYEKNIKLPIIKTLKNIYNNKEQRFRYYHKYIAIVHADGDNISKALHAIYSIKGVKGVQTFSALLMSFGRKIYKKIKDYDGVPIYLGGDDMLFYAPVRNDKKKKQHILGILKNLNEEFKATILDNNEVLDSIVDWNNSITPYNNKKRVDISLSFGVSIAYTKYPIKETLESSRDLLFKNAKNFPGKSAVSFKLQKHSGQTFDTTWRLFDNDKDVVSYDLFLEFVESQIVKDENKLVDENFLASLQYKLEPLTPLIIRILTGKTLEPEKTGFWKIIKQMPDEDERESFFKRLVDNFFNEITHEAKKDFINKSFYYLLYYYRELEDIFGNNPETARKAIDNLYACLRYIQFLKQPDSNEEEDML